MLILGIDPGLANTGWGLVSDGRGGASCVAYGCVTTGARDPLPGRLAAIHDELRAVVRRYHPDHCAVEAVFFGTNAKSAFATGQARGVALLALAGEEVQIAEYSPVQIKGAVTGNGSADKRQVQYMVRELLGLDHTPRPDHASDALAAALCHVQLSGVGRRS